MKKFPFDYYKNITQLTYPDPIRFQGHPGSADQDGTETCLSDETPAPGTGEILPVADAEPVSLASDDVKADETDPYPGIPSDSVATHGGPGINTILHQVSTWPAAIQRRFQLLAAGYQRADRGMGITVTPLDPEAATAKAFREVKIFILGEDPGATPDESPAADQATAEATASPPSSPDDPDFPFQNLHPHTREIVTRSWSSWTADQRQRFTRDVQDVMNRTHYRLGDAVAFVLQTAHAGDNAACKPPALSPAMSPPSAEEEESLRARMWPTPPAASTAIPTTSTPASAIPARSPGLDIAAIVSRWPKARRLEYAGRCGKYSNDMSLREARRKAFDELRDITS